MNSSCPSPCPFAYKILRKSSAASTRARSLPGCGRIGLSEGWLGFVSSGNAGTLSPVDGVSRIISGHFPHACSHFQRAARSPFPIQNPKFNPPDTRTRAFPRSMPASPHGLADARIRPPEENSNFEHRTSNAELRTEERRSLFKRGTGAFGERFDRARRSLSGAGPPVYQCRGLSHRAQHSSLRFDVGSSMFNVRRSHFHPARSERAFSRHGKGKEEWRRAFGELSRAAGCPRHVARASCPEPSFAKPGA